MNNLNEQISRMRGMMGLNESVDVMNEGWLKNLLVGGALVLAAGVGGHKYYTLKADDAKMKQNYIMYLNNNLKGLSSDFFQEVPGYNESMSTEQKMNLVRKEQQVHPERFAIDMSSGELIYSVNGNFKQSATNKLSGSQPYDLNSFKSDKDKMDGADIMRNNVTQNVTNEKIIGLNEDLINEGYWGSIAAGIVPYCDRTKRFLVGLRSGNVMEPHTWGGFGGKLDVDEGVDESIQEAAIRELSEETGYVGSIRLVKGFVFRDDAHDFQYHNFIGIVSDEFDSHLNWENDDALWLTYDKLLNLPDKHFGLNRFIKESRSLFQSLAFKTVNI